MKYTLTGMAHEAATVVCASTVEVVSMVTKARSHSLRIGRYSEMGRIYLVTSRLDRMRDDFSDWRVGRLLVKEMREVHECGFAKTLAWVVMPDHFHWLVKLHHGSLAGIVQRVKSKTAIAVNRVTGNQGRLWQPGYHDAAARHEDDLIHFARYIVANPLRAGLVSRVGDYPLWDSIGLPGSGVEFGESGSEFLKLLLGINNDLPESLPINESS
ncbi:hypothetical protein BBI10_11435 [Pseudomonas graminis]|uniref:Transposase IS200-like domain-containing protein n=1 Tax=Pseudomonas graminis TaxID=158627 RepID=A0A1C2E2G5_9PSED|nr:hypothetical protein BBI10_11435 [Pseudomonas graminis]